MSKSSMSIAPGVIVENVGDDVVVMVPGSTEVIRLSGDAAQLVRAIHDGHAVAPTQAVSDLINRGILVSHTGMSRRGLITAGAIGAGAGITALAMPGVAAASSSSDEPDDGRIALLGDYWLLWNTGWTLAYNTPALQDPTNYGPPFASGNEAVNFDPSEGKPSILTLEGFNPVDNDDAFHEKGVAFWQEKVGDEAKDNLDPVLVRIGSLAPRTGTFEVGDGRYRATFTWRGDLT